MALHWVERQSSTPYQYGVIDDVGKWHLRMGRPFDSVSPFRNGLAQVAARGRRFMIDSRGRKVRDIVEPEAAKPPNVLDTRGKTFALAGRLETMTVGQFLEHVDAIGGRHVEYHPRRR